MRPRSLLQALSTGAVVLFLALVALFIYAQVTPSSSYLLLPDSPHALAPLVEVKDGRKTDKGGIYFVDVIERRASLAERYLPFLRHDATLVSEQQIGPSNVSDAERARIDAQAMALSKKIAEAVALRHLGYKVVIRPRGTLVDQTYPGTPAAKKLLPGDVISAVDGEPTPKVAELRALITRHRVGQIIELTFTRNGHRHRVALRTIASSSSPRVPVIGVLVTQAASIKLPPIEVTINSGNVGGPSAGLAFALELTDKLGPDIDRGYKVAAIGRGSENAPLAKKLGASVYIDSKAANAAGELQKLGGAQVILATAPSSKAMSELIDGLGPNGKLVVIDRKARIGRNPATGAEIQIPAKRALKFRVAKAAKDAILMAEPPPSASSASTSTPAA
ncbi:MAG: HU family DNA-binding protein [Gaiellaceae bacterium]